MKRNFTLFIVLFVILGQLFSSPVSKEEAKKLATTFFKVNSPATRTDVSIKQELTRNHQGTESFYIFNFENGGFVIIAADDRAIPVLGYSLTGQIPEKVNPSMEYLFEQYNNEIADTKSLRSENNTIKNQWTELRENKLYKTRGAGNPLLETKGINWNQEPKYNKFCPPGTPVGCVATAMTQIMKYYSWPAKGNGWHKYIPEAKPEFGEQYANFEAANYDYTKMPNELGLSSTVEQIDAVATLCYHAGVAVNMNYDTDGSGANSKDVLFAMTSYFKYDPTTIQMLTYTAAQEAEYFNKIKTEIDSNRPVYYTGSSKASGGHAFICDGYDINNKIHINWGWGGSANGYFLLSNMVVGSYDFSEYNSMIIGIKPGKEDQEMLWTEQASGFKKASRGIQNISAVDKRTAWAVAYDGSGDKEIVKEYTRTIDGNSWKSGDINASGIDGYSPAMITAVDQNNAWVAMYGTNGGGKIVKTSDGGKNWEVQATATFSAPDGFPNVVHFWDANNGFCMGDPNSGYFEIYTTNDGGVNWTRVSKANIPTNQEKEYGNVGSYAVYGDIVWFATNKGRIFKSTNKGLNWVAYQTPISETTFELSFKDENIGIILERGETETPSKYITNNGGQTWTKLTSQGNFYTNSFSFIPGSDLLVSTGSNAGSETKASFMGVSYSTDNGSTFTDYADFYKNMQFLAIGAADQNSIWAGSYNADANNGGMWHLGATLVTADFNADKTAYCVNSDATFTDKSYGSVDTWNWNFGDGASPATATGVGPHKVSYSTSGNKNVTLTISKGADEHKLVVNEMVKISSSAPEASSITGDVNVNVFETKTYSVTNIENTTYTWNSPADWTKTTKNNSIDLTFLASGTKTISVTPANVCGNGEKVELDITANCTKANAGTITGSKDVKIGETKPYTVPYQKYVSYIWDIPTDWTGSSTSNTINVTFNNPSVNKIKVTPTSNACGDGETSEFEITVSEATAINNPAYDAYTVYPNPASDYIRISGVDNTNIYIYTSLGKMIKTVSNYQENQIISLSELSTGVYYVKVIINNKPYTQSINIL